MTSLHDALTTQTKNIEYLSSVSLLSLDELIRGAEVLPAVAVRAHDPVQLMGEGPKRGGGLDTGGCVLSQTEVLHHKCGTKTTLP